jgi:hypothetical protein
MRDIINESDKTCLERKCIINFQGKEFESSGAFIGINPKTGKHGGIVYGDWDYKMVGNWHGDIKIPAHYGKEYESNMGDKRRSVWFTYKGIKMYGIWCSINWNQMIRVKEVKQ